MNLLFAFMGGIAKASGRMSRFSINFIPSNWILIGVGLGLAFGFGTDFFSSHDFVGLALALLGLLVGGAFLASSLMRHTIFQKVASDAMPSAPSAFGTGAVQDAALDVPMRMTGKLRLHEKAAQRFLDVSVSLTRLDGQLAFVSSIDASSRMYGAVVNSKRGVWLSIPLIDSLEVEDGLFYHGFKGAPALRLSYTDASDGKSVQNIVAFNTAQDRDQVRAALAAERSRSGGQTQPFVSA